MFSLIEYISDTAVIEPVFVIWRTQYMCMTWKPHSNFMDLCGYMTLRGRGRGFAFYFDRSERHTNRITVYTNSHTSVTII